MLTFLCAVCLLLILMQSAHRQWSFPVIHKVGNVVIAGLFRVNLLPPANKVCKGLFSQMSVCPQGGFPERDPSAQRPSFRETANWTETHSTETPWTEITVGQNPLHFPGQRPPPTKYGTELECFIVLVLLM